LQCQRVPKGSATARSIAYYSLNRWAALTHYLGDNNWIENGSRPTAGAEQLALRRPPARRSARGGGLGLIASAQMNVLDPYAYLSDALAHPPTHPARRVAGLLPHRWQSAPVH